MDADLFGDVLVEGDGIAKRTTAGMRRGGEETDVRRVAAIDVRMGDAAENAEIVAMRREALEVGREGVVTTGVRGEELIGEEAKIVADAEHPARLRVRSGRCAAGRGAGEGWEHRVEEGQRHDDAGAAEKMPAGDGALGGDVGGRTGRGHGRRQR